MGSGGAELGVRWGGAILALAVGVANLAVLVSLLRPFFQEPENRSNPSVERPRKGRVRLPVLQAPPGSPPVSAAPRGVSASVVATARVRAAPWAPGLRLRETKVEENWEGHRAIIEDLTTRDRRAYAIGDLLPHGSLLVGVSAEAAQVLVADRELIELKVSGRLRSLEDFSAGYEPQALRRAPAVSEDFLAEVERAIGFLGAKEPAHVQAAIDALIGAGEPVVEFLLKSAGETAEVPRQTYAFPSPDGPMWRPRVQGDLVVGVLEAITGQSFGDVFAEGLAPEARGEIIESWRRWWGRTP